MFTDCSAMGKKARKSIFWLHPQKTDEMHFSLKLKIQINWKIATMRQINKFTVVNRIFLLKIDDLVSKKKFQKPF